MTRVLAALGASCCLACSEPKHADRSPPPAPPPIAAPGGPARAPVEIEMKNVRLHLDDGITLDVRTLRGQMVSRTDAPPMFDDPKSYVMRIASADLSIDMASLTSLMNNHVFGYEGAPLTDVTVRATHDARLEQKGKLHKGIGVPVSMVASVATTPDGKLKLHVDSVKAVGVPATGLMDLFGLKIESLVDLKARRGVSIDGNDIVIAPGQVLPGPEMQGRLTRVEIRGDRLIQTMSPEAGRAVAALSPPDPRAKNYVYFSGSEIRFGKLTMYGADLQLIDLDPSDAFDFYPARYLAQLVAGYSKNTEAGGLKTYMPDFDSLPRSSARK